MSSSSSSSSPTDTAAMEEVVREKPQEPQKVQEAQAAGHMILANAVSMVQSMPPINLGAMGLSEDYVKSMHVMATQIAFSNAVVVAGAEQRLTAIVSAHTARLSHKLDQASNRFDQRLTVTEQTLQQQLQDNKAQLENKMQEVTALLEAHDPVSTAWSDKNNLNLRQLIAYIMATSVDTRNKLGLMPIMTFAYWPGRELTEDNLLVVINKQLLRLLLLHHEQFISKPAQSIQGTTERNIMNTFNCVSLEGEDLDRVIGLFGVEPVKSTYKTSVFVMRATKLVRLMQEELKFMAKEERVMKKDVKKEGALIVKTKISRTGTLTVKPGGALPFEKHVKAARGVLSKRTAVKFRSFEVKDLFDFASKQLGTRNGRVLLDYLATCRFCGVPASKEYLEQKAVVDGINMIRTRVFKLSLLSEACHMSEDWQELFPGEPALPFAELMAEKLELDSKKEFVNEFMAYAEPENLETESEEDNEEQQKASRKRKASQGKQPKPKQKPKVVVKPKAKVVQAKVVKSKGKRKEDDDEEEVPANEDEEEEEEKEVPQRGTPFAEKHPRQRPFTGGKQLPQYVLDACRASQTQVDEEEEEEEEQEEEEVSNVDATAAEKEEDDTLVVSASAASAAPVEGAEAPFHHEIAQGSSSPSSVRALEEAVERTELAMNLAGYHPVVAFPLRRHDPSLVFEE